MNGRRVHEAYPVNPKYKYIGVTSCWPSLSEVPAKIDLAVFATPSSKIEGLLKECKKLAIPNVLNHARRRRTHGRPSLARTHRSNGS